MIDGWLSRRINLGIRYSLINAIRLSPPVCNSLTRSEHEATRTILFEIRAVDAVNLIILLFASDTVAEQLRRWYTVVD